MNEFHLHIPCFQTSFSCQSLYIQLSSSISFLLSIYSSIHFLDVLGNNCHLSNWFLHTAILLRNCLHNTIKGISQSYDSVYMGPTGPSYRGSPMPLNFRSPSQSLPLCSLFSQSSSSKQVGVLLFL